MIKVWRRRLILIAVFILVGVIHFLVKTKMNLNPEFSMQIKDYWVILIALLFAGITLLLDAAFYSKRGIFLYSLIGFIAGFYAGKVLYDLFKIIFQNFLLMEMEPYFMLAGAYLGFYLPLNATQKGVYSFQFPMGETAGGRKSREVKLLDTSVIIDGRIVDIAETGFISGSLVVPKFVLNEIQALADSQDSIKRNRARRGLDVLNRLKEVNQVDLKIYSRDFSDFKGVDAKLIQLAKEIHASIITNDYNLNKIAKLEGITILNLNDLANSLKPILLPGEEMELDVIKEGKEANQGVGYLQDGTMVVVANGLSYIGKRIPVKVTSILQTSAGRIIFTEPKDVGKK